jgi:predicted nucleic-acid-binding protein
MSNKATLELNRVLKSIAKNSFTRSDIAVLLVNLRATTNNKTVTDLANFHTHPEGRTQGVAHAVLQDWVNKFISLAESSGGSITGPTPVFTSKKVIIELLRSLRSLGLQYSEQSIKYNQNEVIEYIKSLVVESEFILDDKRVTRCWISRNDKGGLQFNFQIKGLKPGVIKLGENATIAAPFFDL